MSSTALPKKLKVQIKFTKTSLGWAYRIYSCGGELISLPLDVCFWPVFSSSVTVSRRHYGQPTYARHLSHGVTTIITEIVLWKMPDGISREEILNKFRAIVPAWQANPNLAYKAFLFDESSRRGGGVYLWKNIEAAKQAHGPAFQDRIKSVFGASPEFQYFDAPIVIDNTAKQVIDSAA